MLTLEPGYRAMTNTIGSLVGAHGSGILDCTTYLAGISGSCWALGVLYAGVAGHQNPAPEAAAQHIKSRIATNFLDSSTFNLLTKSPTHKVCGTNFQGTGILTHPLVLALGTFTESQCAFRGCFPDRHLRNPHLLSTLYSYGN